MDSGIELLKASLQRCQLNITRLHWLHEDMFLQEGRQNSPVMVANRATVMSEIKKVQFKFSNCQPLLKSLLNQTLNSNQVAICIKNEMVTSLDQTALVFSDLGYKVPACLS